MPENWITSIGLDIGTSTTKFIASQLLISESGNGFSLPSCQIVDRRVTYSSPIYTTPLINDYKIDMDKITCILEREYGNSQIRMENVKAGAIIITGEAAQKENAQSIIHYLADRAGDFVVATAGADLEGILAGKGSGALRRSTQVEGIIANIDIGGGTANVALFQNGRAIQTITFNVGGRLIRLTENGKIVYISDAIQLWLKKNDFYLELGDTLTFPQVQEICNKMSDSMFSFLSGCPQYSAELLLLDSQPTEIFPIDEVIISGGIGQMMRNGPPATIRNVTKYGDIGPQLAHSLNESVHAYSFIFTQAQETTKATVIGAGMQNTEVSGATIYVNEALLPIKNIPICTIPVVEKNHQWEPESFQIRLGDLLEQAGKIYHAKENEPPIALALSNIPNCTYQILQELSTSILEQFRNNFPSSHCLVILCASDIAKALGQAIARRCHGTLDILCIDQIDFTYGDYIDLGLPVAGESISISVKTLAF